MNNYYPEGTLINSPENAENMKSLFSLQDSMLQGKILEARAVLCDNEHNLIVDLPCKSCPKGIIPRTLGALGIEDGSTKDIALITKVNKPVCFKIIKLNKNKDGTHTAILSRCAVQEECMENFISALSPGDIIPAKVTHLEQFGAFVDIGCGIPSLIRQIFAISGHKGNNKRKKQRKNTSFSQRVARNMGRKRRAFPCWRDCIGYCPLGRGLRNICGACTKPCRTCRTKRKRPCGRQCKRLHKSRDTRKNEG